MTELLRPFGECTVSMGENLALGGVATKGESDEYY